MDKLNVRDADVTGKRVLLRVDFNVPLEDGKVTDDSRVRASIPTLHYLLTHGARVILASHLGRPDGKVQDGLRLRPVAERLSQILGRNVPVTGDALGIGTVDAVKRLRNGELLMLENLRFHAEEEKNDPAFAAQLAEYAELFVNDAFGAAHRAHASTVGVAQLLPAYAGFLLEREITMLQRLRDNPAHPFATVIGGAKISGKLKVLDNLMAKVDVLVVGGGMANTFLLAQGKAVGKSLAEHDMVDEARRVLAAAEKAKVQVILPVDVVVAKEVTRGTEYKTIPAEKIPASWHVVDVGRATLDLMEDALASAKTVFWNGPLGVFEIPSFAHGTRAIARYLATRADAGATVVVGGGDSVAAIQQQGLAERFTHISTGGGASLEFLEGRELPGVAVLLDRPPPVKKPRVRPSRAKAAGATAAGAKPAGAKPAGAPTKAAPTEAAPTKAAPTKAAPTKAAPTKAAPTKAAPTKAAPTKAAPTKAAPTKPTPAKATSAKAIPAKATATKATATRATATKVGVTATKASTSKATSKATPAKATATKATATKAAG